ncbi:MAG: DNA polymerase III subunit beta [Syntrophales bacterium]|jgi:DNA polymerase-3 subunit beta|nr:DNA polymerase III subunit beta [Syntrophales bacterium]
MEFNIKRDIFLSGIQKTLGIVEKKTTMPILNNLLLRAIPHRIKIMATDMEIGLVSNYETEVITEGEITVSARKLYEMVREIQGENIHVVKNEKNVVIITCNKAIYRILGLPADDYPVIEENDDFKFYKLKGNILKDLMRKTYFAISNDEMRKNLTGVLLETEKKDDSFVVRMVSTDSHRLSFAVADIKSDDFLITADYKNIIIPKKGVGEITRLLDENEAEYINLGVNNGLLIVKTDKTILKASLIDGDYPDYKRVIPANRGVIIKIERDKLLHAVRRMCVVSSEKYNGVIMTLSKGRVYFNSINNDIGEANDEIEVDYDGEERNIGYNVKYLADAVEVIEEEMVDFEINEDMRPTILRGAGNDSYFCIIMPLKI